MCLFLLCFAAYFLLVCILQTIGTISITGGVPTSAVPLTAVIGFDGILTAIEDWRRHVADDKVNSRTVTRLGPSGWEDIASRDVRVGDRVKIRSGEVVPADCVLLYAKHESPDGDPAVCYVKTDQLDGESNLKLKRTPADVARTLSSHSRLRKFQGMVECGPPDADFHRFRGNIVMPMPPDADFLAGEGAAAHASRGGGDRSPASTGLPSGVEPEDVSQDALQLARHLALRATGGEARCMRHPVGAEALLLRGTEVRGVEFAVGLVTYTGNETKIRVQASKKPQPKSSLMERQMNGFLVIIILAQIAVCLLGAIMDRAFVAEAASQDWYLRLDMGPTTPDGKQAPAKGDGSSAGEFLARVGTFFLLTAQFIPVSLYVSIRGARQIQQLTMQLDRGMTYRLEGAAAASALADRATRKAAARRANRDGSGLSASASPGSPSAAALAASSSHGHGVADWPDSAAPVDGTRPPSAAGAAAGALEMAPSPLSPAHPDSLLAARRHSLRAARPTSSGRTATPSDAVPAAALSAPGSAHAKRQSGGAVGAAGAAMDKPLHSSGGARGQPKTHGGETPPSKLRIAASQPAGSDLDVALASEGGRSGNPLSTPDAMRDSERRLLDDASDFAAGAEPRQRLTVARTRSGTRRTDAAADPPAGAAAAAAAAAAAVAASSGHSTGSAGRGGKPAPASRRDTEDLPARGPCGGCCGQGGTFECCAPGPEARVLGGSGMCFTPVYELFDDAAGAVPATGADGEVEPPPVIYPTVRTMELNDELGQVTHIFSDKTGTLTRNSFEFRKLSVGGVEYGRGTTTIGLARLRRSANASDSASRAAVTTPTDPAAVTAAEVAEAERMLDEGERAVRALPHVNFLDGVTVPAAAGGGPGAPQCRSLAGDLGVPAAATASVRTPASRGGSYGSLGKTPSPRDSLHSSPPPLMSQAWLEAAGAASMGGPHSLACPGSGRWAEAHVALGAAAGGGADEHGTPLRLADASASDHSLSARGHDTERSASEAAIDAVVRDAGRTPIAALPPPARAALGVELRHFFLNLALDHSVELESRKDESGRVTSVGLSASSPDEEAFVAMAALAGWEFVGRSKGQSRLLLPDGRTRSFATVAELPYTQSRRMMSVLIEMPDAPAARDDPGWADHGLGRGKYAVYCKGADSRIAELAAGGPNARGFAAMAGVPESSLSSKPERAAESHNACVQGATEGHMNAWAADGLRTLAFAWRPLSRHWVEEDCGVGTYDAWRARCEGARGKTVKPTHASSGPVGWKRLWSLVTEDQENKKLKDLGEPNAIDDAMGVLERALRMQGATGIEDRLQAGVPEAVAALRDAGIKVYMLTGDKRATAVNIGFAVQLLTEEHLLVELTKDKLLEDAERARGCGSAEGVQRFGTAMMRPPASDDADDVDAWLAAVVRDQLQGLDPERTRGRSTATSQPLALVLDDPVLAALTGEKGTPDETQQQQMRALARRVMESAESVVCCRCSPAHKKAVVRLIKYGPQGGRSADRAVTTLAIGDGANDVEMIMEASVGVGVQGAEGAQAANSADYAIGQFRFLQRLLLVHGRWNYRRMAYLVLYSLYKNFQFTFVTYFMQIYMGFSGQKFIVELAIQTFNLVYVAFPIVWAAVLDQDVDQDSAQRFPAVYREGRDRSHMQPWRLAAWALAGVWEAAAITFGLCLWLGAGSSMSQFGMPDVFTVGQAAFTSMIIVLNVQVSLAVGMHHWSFQLIVALSALIWIPAAFVFDSFNADGTRGAIPQLFSSLSFWLAQLAILAAALAPMLIARACARNLAPSFARLVQEAQILVRRGAHDSSFMVDRFDVDGDQWAAKPGFETEPQCSGVLGTLTTCGNQAGSTGNWEELEMRFRKFPFASKIAMTREAVLKAGGSSSDAQEAEFAMRERVDKVFVGRGWSKGCDVPGATNVRATRSPLGSVRIEP